MSSEAISKSYLEKFLFDLVTSGLEGNTGRVEIISLSLARLLRKDNPAAAKKIEDAISLYSLQGSSAMRSAGMSPLPVDAETQLEMASVFPPNDELNSEPILDPYTQSRILNFIEERKKIETLLAKNIKPSNSLLLTGQPGTGKTMLAKYIATALGKNLIVLDLSASISSLLGKTGHNLKRVLQYAKQTSSVLLLDEFDAIAKRRDDSTDLGEIKRVVNVLLMELEDWPISSVLIATSNHPELLDKAIWRRFDHNIIVHLPSPNERVALLKQQLESVFLKQNNIDSILKLIAELLEGRSAADICKFTNNVKRRMILKEETPIKACVQELEQYLTDKKMRAKLVVLAKEVLGKSITVREISDLTGLSVAGVQHHISKIKTKK